MGLLNLKGFHELVKQQVPLSLSIEGSWGSEGLDQLLKLTQLVKWQSWDPKTDLEAVDQWTVQETVFPQLGLHPGAQGEDAGEHMSIVHPSKAMETWKL